MSVYQPGVLYPLSEGIWLAEHEMKLVGIPFRTRMYLVQLPDGDLVMHSPIPPNHGLTEAVWKLGTPNWRIAPNLHHHLFQTPWQELCATSRLLAPKGLEKKRPDLRIDGTLPQDVPPQWAGVLEAFPILGNPVMKESVFLHRPSRSLILTDLAMSTAPGDHWILRLYGRLNGLHGKLGVSHMLRRFYKDWAAARASLDAILDQDFTRVLTTHGPLIENGGKDALAAAFSWLKP
ncbi:hypothetical protein ACFSM5_04885 [Lacibacterium aquatile]|uniref:DUF4336 domain-containing protein n=1 Tax=Lacibacterium aquatile TaxID=1168082 RepID=A0ABW5DM42_9PROT